MEGQLGGKVAAGGSCRGSRRGSRSYREEAIKEEEGKI